mmetsp:Transcript_107875/g.315371  ORF Transcript_107875/g.315371 Transcript_107875/m.315371 type:complete len:281 (+) Transcript_107875:489-1331(+)
MAILRNGHLLPVRKLLPHMPVEGEAHGLLLELDDVLAAVVPALPNAVESWLLRLIRQDLPKVHTHPSLVKPWQGILRHPSGVEALADRGALALVSRHRPQLGEDRPQVVGARLGVPHLDASMGAHHAVECPRALQVHLVPELHGPDGVQRGLRALRSVRLLRVLHREGRARCLEGQDRVLADVAGAHLEHTMRAELHKQLAVPRGSAAYDLSLTADRPPEGACVMARLLDHRHLHLEAHGVPDLEAADRAHPPDLRHPDEQRGEVREATRDLVPVLPVAD